MVCCDTSFLFSLYGNDAHTARAQTMVRGLSEPVRISLFNEFEILNAFRLAIFRRLWKPEDVAAMQAAFDADCSAGRLLAVNCNLAEVLTEAMRLSAAHTPTNGNRAFDILHVSAALVMSADRFLSFDENQRSLATRAGLNVVR